MAASSTGRLAAHSKKASPTPIGIASRRSANFRALWIARINAQVREHGLNYSRFIDGLHKAGIELDRKQLALLALQRDELFRDLVRAARDALGQQAA